MRDLPWWLAPLFLALSALLLAPSGPVEAREANPVSSSTIKVGDTTWTLRLSIRDATLKHGWRGVLAHYTVRRQGQTAHPQDEQGGRIVGLRFASEALSAFRATTFPDAHRPVGWMLRVGASRGNTSSDTVRLILPGAATGDATYGEATFEAKAALTTRWRQDQLEIWGQTQDWGAGGTASSLFVPWLRVLGPEGRITRTALPSDRTAWPAMDRGTSHIECFVAGVRQRNPALLRVVLAAWDVPDGRAEPGPFGLPIARTSLEEIVEAVEAAVAAERRLAEVTGTF